MRNLLNGNSNYYFKLYFSKFLKGSFIFLSKALTVLSFLMMIFYFGYIVYYSAIDYCSIKVLTGCVSLWIMIHLNHAL